MRPISSSPPPGASHGTRPTSPPAATRPSPAAASGPSTGLQQLGRPPAPAPAGTAQAAPRAAAALSPTTHATAGIARGEVALAAYLTARILVGRPVGLGDIARLRSANASVNETRQRLPLGRGNVKEDNAATDGQARWRASAARSFAHRLDREHHVPRDDLGTRTLHQAAAATAFSAGRCGEYSPVAAVLHSSRLQSPESLHIVASMSHQWTEARLGDDRDRAVVLDAWADGPAILATDGEHARAPTRWLRHYEPMGPARPGAENPDAARDLLDEVTSDLQAQLGDAGLRRHTDAEARPTARLVAAFDNLVGLGDWSSPQVLSGAFITQAQELLAGDSLSAEIAAARVARQLGGTAETQRADIEAILATLAGFKR